MRQGIPIPKVALLGLEGSGKTVLVTTLAKRFSVPEDGKMYVTPQGLATLQYVEQNWKILQSGQWPRSTYTGEMINLLWKLYRPKGEPCELRMVDMSGQVLRHLFSQDPVARTSPLPDHLAMVEGYCHEADIILLLLNIRDFIGEGDDDRHLANQMTLFSAIQQINNKNDKQVAVIFTQFDRYGPIVQQYGGLNNFLKKEVNYIYGDQVHGKPAMTMTISAVSDTTTHIDQNGSAMLLPRPGFRSSGLDELMTWIGQAIRRCENQAIVDDDYEMYAIEDVDDEGHRHKPIASVPPRRPQKKRDTESGERKADATHPDEGILGVLRRSREYSGRARRREFWHWTVFYFFATVFSLCMGLGSGYSILIFVGPCLFAAHYAVLTRRLHDIGMSGSLSGAIAVSLAIGILSFIMLLVTRGAELFEVILGWSVIGFVVLNGIAFFLCLKDSQKGTNKYGPNPKGE